jgi:hypothetical protein
MHLEAMAPSCGSSVARLVQVTHSDAKTREWIRQTPFFAADCRMVSVVPQGSSPSASGPRSGRIAGNTRELNRPLLWNVLLSARKIGLS